MYSFDISPHYIDNDYHYQIYANFNRLSRIFLILDSFPILYLLAGKLRKVASL